MRFGALAVLTLAWAHPASARQVGSFVSVLGVDTVHVERFSRVGNRLEGTVVTRSPVTRVIRYSLTLDLAGRPAEYRVATHDPDGNLSSADFTAGSLAFQGDTVLRTTLVNGAMATQRVAVPPGAVPGPMLPYLGVSYLMYEIGFAAARRRAGGTGEDLLPLVTMFARQTVPQQARVWFVSPDSVEMDYFGVARSGWAFGADGILLRSDWTGTTYRYRITRGPDIDVEAIARAWGRADAAGRGMGVISPRDTVSATVGAGDVTIVYGRPAARGRPIWGALVAWDAVWRFGADAATHLTLSTDLEIGGQHIPAGTYTLWMVPMEHRASLLVINTRTRIFGTGYDPSADLVRIPLLRSAPAASSERFTLSVSDGRLWIRWADGEWSVSLSPP